MDAATHRLPRTVEPEHYDLTFSLHLDQASFAGEERVRVRLHDAVERVELHAADLEVHEAELIGDDGTVRSGRVALDEAEERCIITLDTPAPAGEATLHLTFTGRLGDRLAGPYRSEFTDASGTRRVIAATQFEPADARRAFPCWDEPDRKATFAVTLVVDDGLTAVSNSEVIEEVELGDGRKQVRFAPTMRMSTYLVAFVVGPLAVTEPVDANGVPVRVVCVPGKEHLAHFSLEVAAHCLSFFARYFAVPYPAAKLDLIALPDFAMGAMENLGAVTFRETLLLVDPERAARTELERVADVVAHELAHMWFGDLVTMRWWNGIWLNEAFATFMELLAVDDFRPEWERWVTFGANRSGALTTDGLVSTRPVEFPVGRPEEAEAMFDVLTYQKGAGVLRMLEQYLGAEAFQAGIARYIDTHRYANTETADLWDALEAASGEPVRSTMESWIFQPGYPVVSVEADGATLWLRSRRFRYLASDGPAGDGGGEATWAVPLMLRASVGGEVVRRRLLLTGPASVDLGGPPDWVVVNEGGWGFYRVEYDPALLAALRADPSRLEALERYSLVADTWAGVLAGSTPLSEFLALANAVAAAERDPSVWSALLGALGFVDRVVDDASRPALQALVRRLARPAFDELGWDPAAGEPERTRTLRGLLVQALGVLGADAGVRATAARLHGEELASPGSVDPDVLAAVVTVAAAAGGEEEYEAHLGRFRQATTPQDEVRYLYSLAAFEQPGLVARTMDLATSEVRSQNGPFLVSLLLANRVGGRLAWESLQQRWDAVMARFPEALLDRMLEGVTALTEPEVAAGVRAFLGSHPIPSRQRSIDQLLERLEIAVAFRQREAPALAATLAAAT